MRGWILVQEGQFAVYGAWCTGFVYLSIILLTRFFFFSYDSSSADRPRVLCSNLSEEPSSVSSPTRSETRIITSSLAIVPNFDRRGLLDQPYVRN